MFEMWQLVYIADYLQLALLINKALPEIVLTLTAGNALNSLTLAIKIAHRNQLLAEILRYVLSNYKSIILNEGETEKFTLKFPRLACKLSNSVINNTSNSEDVHLQILKYIQSPEFSTQKDGKPVDSAEPSLEHQSLDTM